MRDGAWGFEVEGSSPSLLKSLPHTIDYWSALCVDLENIGSCAGTLLGHLSEVLLVENHGRLGRVFTSSQED